MQSKELGAEIGRPPPEKLYRSLRVKVLTRVMQVQSQDAGSKQDAPGKQRKRRWLSIM